LSHEQSSTADIAEEEELEDPTENPVIKTKETVHYFSMIMPTDIEFHMNAKDPDRVLDKADADKTLTFDKLRVYTRITNRNRPKDYRLIVRAPLMALHFPRNAPIGNYGERKYDAKTYTDAWIQLNANEYTGWAPNATVRRDASREVSAWFKWREGLLDAYCRWIVEHPVAHIKAVRNSLNKATMNQLSRLITRVDIIAEQLEAKTPITKAAKKFYATHSFLKGQTAHNLVTSGKVIGVPLKFASQNAYLRKGRPSDSILDDETVGELIATARHREIERCKKTGTMRLRIKLSEIYTIFRREWTLPTFSDKGKYYDGGGTPIPSRIAAAKVKLFTKMYSDRGGRRKQCLIKYGYKTPVVKDNIKLSKLIHTHFHVNDLEMNTIDIRDVNNRKLSPFTAIEHMDIGSPKLAVVSVANPDGKVGLRFEPVGLTWYMPRKESMDKNGKMIASDANGGADTGPVFKSGVVYDPAVRKGVDISENMLKDMSNTAINSLP